MRNHCSTVYVFTPNCSAWTLMLSLNGRHGIPDGVEGIDFAASTEEVGNLQSTITEADAQRTQTTG